MAKKSKDLQYCSFCGKPGDANRRLVAGPGVAICNECLAVCSVIIADGNPTDQEELNLALPEKIPVPKELKAYLDRYIIGQEQAKKVLSVAVYNHYKRVSSKAEAANDENPTEEVALETKHPEKLPPSPAPNKSLDDDHEDDVDIEKANVLMIGPTGTGKTLLARTLAKKLNVPFAIADATTLTEAGYVGEDVETILLKLIQAADGNIEVAQNGIIYIDEIDKIARKGDNVSITRDVSGEGVQQALLKIIEGTVAMVPPQGGRKHPNQELLKIDTNNILFICSGAFVGLDKVIENRISSGHLGFNSSADANEHSLERIFKELEPDDLIHFGLIPEFIGRLPINVTLNPLTLDDLKRIITEPKNAIIKQYQASLKLDNTDLFFEEAAIDAIAQKAIDRKTGARGLRAIVEKAMNDLMFEIPSIEGAKKVIITADVIINDRDPIIITDPSEMNKPWEKPLYENTREEAS